MVNLLTLCRLLLDFFELAFIIVPLLGLADKLGIDLIRFGVCWRQHGPVMHPPLASRRSICAAWPRPENIWPHRQLDSADTTGQIYWGGSFVVIQVIMVGIVIAFPGLVTGNLVKSKVDPSKIEINIPTPEEQEQLDRDSTPPVPGAPKTHDENKTGQPEQKQDSGADGGTDLEKLFKSK